MSNKITLATIQFRADAKGANAALESLRQSSKDAHDEANRMREALDRGIKTMKDANGIDFDVAKKFSEMTRQAKTFDQAIRELVKGATALETVVKNIRIGEIEASSRAELKGAINAAEARKRSVRETDPEDLQQQRELNIVIEESRKQLNNLDRDTQKVIETLDKGGTIAQSTLEKEMKGLREILTMIPKGTEEWNKYNQQLQQMETHVTNIRRQEREQASALLGSKDLGKYSEEDIRAAITNAKELLATYKTASPEAKALADNIVRAEQFLKNYGVEAARQAAREAEQLRLEKELATTMNKRLRDLKSLSADALEETRRYWETQKNGAAEGTTEFNKAEAALKKIDGYTRSSRRAELTSLLGDPSKFGVSEVKAAVQEAERLRDSVQKGIPVWFQYNKMVEQGRSYLDQMAKSEAAERINRQMQNLSTLSASGLQEVKRYWETMVAGAEKGSSELAQYEAKLKEVITEEQSRKTAAQQRSIDLFASRDLGGYSEKEIREAIEAAKQLIQTYDTGDSRVKQLAEDIVRAEEYLKQYGVEAERTAQRERQALEEAERRRQEQDQLMQQQLSQGTTLSQSALRQQEQYWQRLIDDPKTAAASLQVYKDNLEQVRQLQTQMALTQSREQADKLMSGNFGAMSEGEIRAAITAAREYQQTLKTSDTAYKELSKSILNAEEYVKKFGIEADRAERKEAEAAEKAKKALNERINLMIDQWNKTNSTMSESALKNHERFWQQLIDDPKTASESLDEYREALETVQRVIKRRADEKIDAEGQSALSFFRGDTSNASVDQIKEQADALKKYRNSLPRKDNADLLIEIDSYLEKSGQVAKEATGELMNLGEALEMAGKAGKDGFSATEDEIKKAIASIEKAIEIDRELAKQHRRAGNTQMAEYNEEEIKEYEKALKGLNLELKNVGISHERMQKILEDPINADNLDELRAAIKRAKAELNSMDGALGENRIQYDTMAKSVKQAEQQLKVMEGQARGTASAFEKAWSRLKTYVGLYVGASVAMNKLMGTIGDIHELSDRMGEVGKTTQMTADEVGRLTTNLKKIDTRTGIVQLLELSAAAGQLGLKSEQDIQGFTEAANMLTVALPEMGKEAATEMMRVAIATGEVNKIQKEMQEGAIEGSSATAVAMTKIASTIDRLRASSASAAPEITDFVKRVGAVGAQSGITIDQVAALGSTVSSLGMRIEMSATALSRMIPAIKGNAFELSKAIGVTPETIRNLFDTGRGMEVILMILQRIKDSGMDADSIENMLGMAGMKDIMKDLNQQGARAGIVFSGLSQNVDELRRQLGVAKEAYEENIAIQREYDRMNETTAAKWERLKNQVEEMFVGDESQRMIGGLIEGLQKLLSLVTENSRAFIYAAVAIGSFKAGLGEMVAGGITKLKGLKFSIDSVKKSLLTWPNLWNAIGTVAVFAIMKIVEAATSLGEVSKSMGEVEKQLRKEMATADKLFRSLAKVREEERHTAEAAKEQAAAEEKKNKTTEKSTEKTKQLSKETEKLTKSEKDAAEQAGKVEDGMKRVNTEGNRSAAIIREINSKYGTYLGYMISETSSARQLADARELINKKLRETITLKQKEAAMSDIEQEYGSKVRKGASSTDDLIAQYFSGNDEAYARVSVAVNEAAQKYAKDSKKFNEEVRKIVTANRKYISQGAKKDFRDAYAQSGRGATDDEIVSSIASNIGVRAEDYRKSVEEYQKQTETAERVFEARTNVLRKESREATVKTLNSVMADWREALDKYNKAEGEEKEKLAVEVYKQQRAYNNLFANNSDYFTNDSRKGTIERSIENMKTYEKGLREVADESIRAVDAAERAETKITNTDFTNGGNGANNPWGTPLGGESTDWKNMTAEQLVNRRKQMKDFVNAIQTDTDVQSVLKEDAALRKAIEKGMSSDMRTVIEWYNTERLKIQDELHARHLTNTGDWLDPKKQRNAHKQFRDEMDAYLHEIDAYYTERKTRIEEAGTDEGLTEAEIRNRTLSNEMEWQQRRAELQKLYSRKQKEVTQEELDAIYHIIAERTGDSESFVKAQIAKTNQFVDSIEKSGEKGAAIVHRWMSQVELDTERSYLKGQQALTKQMRAIEAIVDKERPFNGITKSLQESLSTMDILTGEMRKEYNELMKQGKDMADFNNRQAQEEMKRTAFLLGEAENAYSTTIDRVMDDMRQKGMTAWADWLSADPKLQEALMAQLRSTYDAIQDAIKKEASQLKKQAEIMWNNILMPDGKTTLKQQTDRVIAQLGLDEGRVKRANSLIGAGQASERVADKLAIQQMKIQLAMQEHYYNLMRKQGQAHVDMLKAQAKAAKERGDTEEATRKTLDAQHAQMSLNLATSKEETELAKQREDIIARTEESQNRLYTELKSWADLMTSSVHGMFEAESAGNREYYNERAKLNLTGKGGPGAGTYIIIENEGTEDATAHYEYLDERAALERQHEIELQNARADAWKKVMDDINQKMNDTITDQLNAMLQNQSIDANTQALIANTQALWAQMGQDFSKDFSDASTLKRDAEGFAVDGQGQIISPIAPQESSEDQQLQQGGVAWGWPMTEEDADRIKEYQNALWDNHTEYGITKMQEMNDAVADMPSVVTDPYPTNEAALEKRTEMVKAQAEAQKEASKDATQAIVNDNQKQQQSTVQTNTKMEASGQSLYAHLTAACNLYGAAYQAMSNDNMDMSQKFQMVALQAAGNAAIAALTAANTENNSKTISLFPLIFGKCVEINPIAGAAIFAALTAVIGGLMGMAASKVAKGKSEIAQVTKTSSAGAGRLSTGMLTYAEGNVNEFTDPASLTPGRHYNVDAADGRTYRAKYTGKNPSTHLTSGPEFHLAGERGREMIIDAGTTRQITMNESEIWHTIQTLSGGGRLRHAQRRGRGVRAFAEGNVDEFEEISEVTDAGSTASGMGGEQMAAFQSSLDRNNELLDRALTEGIHAHFDVYGKGGLIDSYDQGKKTVSRHGEKY